ncbi:MAG: DNA translocase FtsK 4TM domain-containing protein [Candidatus Paceibacterota bacterium]
MAQRKKKEGVNSLHLKEETRYWIFAITAFVLGVFLLLASLGSGGPFGKTLYLFISNFFGWGYFLFPLILFILAYILIRKMRPELVVTSSIGIGLLFISGLALLALLLEKGGAVGLLISQGLVAVFDVLATTIILVALFFISLLLTFDSTPPIHKIVSFLLFWRKKGSDEYEEVALDEEYYEEGDEEDEDEEYDEEEEYDDEEEEEEKPKKKLGGLFSKKKDEDDIDTIAPPLKIHEYSSYTFPPLSLLKKDSGKPGVGDIKANANIIKRTLQNFGINVEMDEISIGPSVTRYALKPAQGIKLARIVGLKNDLSLALAAHPLRIEAPIPGKSLVGIEIPNTSRTTVGLATLLAEPAFKSVPSPLAVSLGRSVTGKPYFASLTRMPHLLVAGATGSGKSVAIHSLVASLLFANAPEHLRFIMVDPKRVELTLYNKIPHLLTPVLTDPKKAILALKWAAKEMDRRYDVLEAESVRDIESYHKNIVEPAYTKAPKGKREKHEEDEKEENLSLPERLPYIVIIIDELADIMSTYPRELESGIVRLAQMSRAVGIHLILSTQRPSVNVITGLIKANVPARMAFQVASQTDSRTILDTGGAETLLGAGDMLYAGSEMSKPVRLQSAFVTESEIKKVVSFIRKEAEEPHYAMDITDIEGNKNSLFEAIENGRHGDDEEEDDLYETAREIIIESKKASTTFLQRKLRVGYARAARLMDMLEERGVIGPADGSRPREVYEEGEEGYGEGYEDEKEGKEDKER